MITRNEFVLCASGRQLRVCFGLACGGVSLANGQGVQPSGHAVAADDSERGVDPSDSGQADARHRLRAGSRLSADRGEPVLGAVELAGDHGLEGGVQRRIRPDDELAQRPDEGTVLPG